MTMIATTPAQGLRMPPDGPRLFAAADPGVHTHLATYGTIPDVGAEHLLEQVRISGLTGRGGAGLPVADRPDGLAGLARRAGGRAVVVANGAEADPASHKDVELLWRAPHLVLDGIEVAARIAGAGRAVAYLHPQALPAVRQALAEHPRGIPIAVVAATGGFADVADSAVVRQLSTASGRSRFGPRRLLTRITGNWTPLVENVETLAQLALIARYGGVWFASAGTPDSTGTFLATVHPSAGAGAFGAAPAGSVWEINHGLSLRQVLAGAGIAPEQVQAVLIGGSLGTWLPLPAALEAPLSRAGLQPFGAATGTGVLIPVGPADCGLRLTAAITGRLAREVAADNGSGIGGLSDLAGRLDALAAGQVGRSGLDAVRRAAAVVEGQGDCPHGPETARMVRSALRVFADDVRLHQYGRCLTRLADPYGDLR